MFLLENPVGADAEIQKIQLKLKERLPWLEVAYGKATRNQERTADGKLVFYPEVFKGTGMDYLRLAPDDNVQAQSFFKLEDPGQVTGEFNPYGKNGYEYGLSVIFWFDLSKIDPTKTYRYNEELKRQIINVLSVTGFQLEKIYETAAQVWKDYTLGNMENRGLRHPYGGYRFEGKIYFDVPFSKNNQFPIC